MMSIGCKATQMARSETYRDSASAFTKKYRRLRSSSSSFCTVYGINFIRDEPS